MADVPKLPSAPSKPSQQSEAEGMSLFSNALAIVGFVILAVIIIWGLIHLVSLSSPWFSSLFAGSGPTVEVTAPQQATSGDQVTITWKYTGSEVGTYSLLYACEQGFQFAFVGSSTEITCGQAISVGSSTSATLMPALSGSAGVNVPVSIVFTPETAGAMNVEGSATIAVAPATETQTQQTTQASTTPIQVISPAHPETPSNLTPVGSADLSVSILAVGVIDPNSGALLNEAPSSPDQTVGVEFDIRNNGPEASGPYIFEAHLPTETPYTYTSPTQASLQPGAHVVSTLRFTDGAPGGIFTVDVDPSNQVNDPNRANNEASQTIN